MFKLDPIPEVGQAYYYYDDGKITPSRQGLLKVVSIIPKKDYIIELYDTWKQVKEECDFVYANDTDYFIETEPVFDLDLPELVFVRTNDGGWFSFNNWLFDGRLDVTNELTNSLNLRKYGIKS